jgi:nitrate/TMAO reductase-like tetraheme cytochrome c subunit
VWPWLAFLLVLLAWAALGEWPDSRPVQRLSVSTSGTTPGATATAPGWGQEDLAEAPAGLDRFSPLGVANACGLGASSCFRCHSGTRAAAPKSDAAQGPWHRDHAKVNYSCVGCHQGNARLLKEDLAHARMVVNPLLQESTCTSCHKAGNSAELLARYPKPSPSAGAKS